MILAMAVGDYVTICGEQPEPWDWFGVGCLAVVVMASGMAVMLMWWRAK
jgi:hypothetical protein